MSTYKNKLFAVCVIIAGIALSLSALSAEVYASTSKPVIKVSTDKDVYEPDEIINIFVKAENPGTEEIELNLNTSLYSDYVIDDSYRWSNNKIVLTYAYMPKVKISPESSIVVCQFSYNPNEEKRLTYGEHNVLGEVVGYGGDDVTIQIAKEGEPSANSTATKDESWSYKYSQSDSQEGKYAEASDIESYREQPSKPQEPETEEPKSEGGQSSKQKAAEGTESPPDTGDTGAGGYIISPEDDSATDEEDDSATDEEEEDVNQSPDISALPDALDKNEGDTIEAAEIELATDADGDPLTYTYSGWLTSLPYTTTYDDAGTHTLHVDVSDGTDTVGKDITITVADDITPPSAPTLNPEFVNLSTKVAIQRLTGSKDADSSVILNSTEIVPLDSATSWSYEITLTEGNNILTFTSKDAAGNESSAYIANIILDTQTSISIDEVYTPTIITSQTVTGIRETDAAVSVTTSATASSVTYPSSTIWEVKITDLVIGENTVTAEAEDSLGNTAIATIIIERIATRVTSGLIAFYPFNEGSGTVVHDQSGYGTSLDLDILDPGIIQWLPDSNGVEFTDLYSAIMSPTPATKIREAVIATNRVTLEAWVTPATLSPMAPCPDCPRRIATISEGEYNGMVNIHLGHRETHGSFRIRTTETNDSNWWMEVPDVFVDTVNVVHLVVTWDGATQKMFVNGVEQATTQALGGDLSNWDTDYPLIIGNEATFNRCWLGKIFMVALYNKALTPEEIEQNYQAGHETSGLIAFYPFNEGSGTVVHDQSGYGTSLDLDILNPGIIQWLPDSNGVEFTEVGSGIRSPAAAAKIHEAITATNRVTLEAWLIPADLSPPQPYPECPRRIITISEGRYLPDMNIHLGQREAHVGFRLRTTEADNSNWWMEVTDAFKDTVSLVHIVVTWDGSTKKMFIDGVEQMTTQTVGGDLSNWDATYPLIIGNEADVDRCWLGKVFMIAIYNRVLTSEEILQNYQAGLP